MAGNCLLTSSYILLTLIKSRQLSDKIRRTSLLVTLATTLEKLAIDSFLAHICAK